MGLDCKKDSSGRIEGGYLVTEENQLKSKKLP